MKNLVLFASLLLIQGIAIAQPFGNAITLDGSNDFIEVPNHSSIDVNNNLTLEAWIKPCVVTGHHAIFSKLWCSGGQNSYYFSIKDGKLRWTWFQSACGPLGSVFESNSIVLSANTWNHVSVVHTSTGVSFYLNGLPLPSTLIQGNFSPLRNSNQPFRIGAYKVLGGNFGLLFNGQIDEVRIWNSTQTSADILSRYNGPLLGTESNLVGYYDMNLNTSGANEIIPNIATTLGAVPNGTTIGTSSTPYYQNISGSLILGPDTTLCPGDQLTLNASITGTTYTWQDGSINSSFIVNQPGSYSVSYVNTCGTVADTIVVLYDSLPNTNLGSDTAICVGSTINLNAFFPGATYVWQDNTTNATLNVTLPGQYSVTATGLCGIASDSINVSNIQPLVLNLGADTSLCPSTSLVLNATNPNTTYLWSDNSTDSILTINSAGVYWVKVSNICDTITDTITINALTIPQANLGNDTVICPGDTIILGTVIPNANYLWSTGSNQPTISVTNIGSFWVQVSNQCGSSSDTVLISNSPPLVVNLGSDTTLCDGDTLVLNPNIGTGTFLWQDNSTSATFTVTTGGTYWLFASNNCGNSSDTIVVTYTPNPIVNLGNDTLLCSGNTIVLDITTQNATYLWSDNSTSPQLNITQEGRYWGQVSVGNCSASDSIEVFETVLDLGNDTLICEGDSILLDATNPFSSYLWNTGSTNSTITVTNNNLYWVELTNSCGTFRDSIAITTLSLSNLNLGQDTSLCLGDTFSINLSFNNSTYLWSDGATDSSYFVHQTDTIWVTISNKCWTDSDTLNAIYLDIPVIEIGNDTNLCVGNSLLLDATISQGNYLWQDGSTQNTFLVIAQGNFNVIAQNICGTVTDSINVNFDSVPIIDLGSDTIIQTGDTIFLNAFNIASTYLWQDGSMDSTLIVTTPNTYWVTATRKMCSASDTITITLQLDSVALEMPNIFTPNSDGINDFFIPVFRSGITSIQIQIFNKWGTEIYYSEFLDVNWDGRTLSGIEVATGTYFWFATYTDEKGEQHSAKGNVMILR